MCCCLLIHNREDCSVGREAVCIIIHAAMDTLKEFFETGLLLEDCGPGWSALSVTFPCTTLGTIHQCVSCVISLRFCTYILPFRGIRVLDEGNCECGWDVDLLVTTANFCSLTSVQYYKLHIYLCSASIFGTHECL